MAAGINKSHSLYITELSLKDSASGYPNMLFFSLFILNSFKWSGLIPLGLKILQSCSTTPINLPPCSCKNLDA